MMIKSILGCTVAFCKKKKYVYFMNKSERENTTGKAIHFIKTILILIQVILDEPNF